MYAPFALSHRGSKVYKKNLNYFSLQMRCNLTKAIWSVGYVTDDEPFVF